VNRSTRRGRGIGRIYVQLRHPELCSVMATEGWSVMTKPGVVVCDDSPEDDSGDVDDSVRLGPEHRSFQNRRRLRLLHGKCTERASVKKGRARAVVRVVFSRVVQTFLPMSRWMPGLMARCT